MSFKKYCLTVAILFSLALVALAQVPSGESTVALEAPVDASTASPTPPSAYARASAAIDALYGTDVSDEFTRDVIEAVVWQSAREFKEDTPERKSTELLLQDKSPERIEKLSQFYCRAVRGFHDRIYTTKGAQEGLEAAAARLPK